MKLSEKQLNTIAADTIQTLGFYFPYGVTLDEVDLDNPAHKCILHCAYFAHMIYGIDEPVYLNMGFWEYHFGKHRKLINKYPTKRGSVYPRTMDFIFQALKDNSANCTEENLTKVYEEFYQ